MQKRSRALIALAGAVMLVSAACSVASIDEEPLPVPNDATEEVTEHNVAQAEEVTNHNTTTPSGAIIVDVELTEFAVDLSITEFEPGVEYFFRVTNAGVVPHEMMLIAPHENSTTMEMEIHDEMAIAVFEVDDLVPGATVEQTVVFPEDTEVEIEAACFVPGHYEAGMATTITVTG